MQNLDEQPQRSWQEAVVRWLDEAKYKRSLDADKRHLRWVDPYLGNYALFEITRDVVDIVSKNKEQTGVKPSSINRMLAVIRAILRKAQHEWGWLDKVPVIRMRKEEKGRIRWLTRGEASLLMKYLPSHLGDMVAFSLATGLRRANVTGLEWKDVDLVNRHALVHPDQAKAKKAITVPLNSDALTILKNQIGKSAEFVFTYKGKRIVQCNTKAWRKALRKAAIDNFKWHDLRHTWASWHVQNGTTLQELQQLGGWASYDMVLRYAHLSSDHLRSAAERVSTLDMSRKQILSEESNYEAKNSERFATNLLQSSCKELSGRA